MIKSLLYSKNASNECFKEFKCMAVILSMVLNTVILPEGKVQAW